MYFSDCRAESWLTVEQDTYLQFQGFSSRELWPRFHLPQANERREFVNQGRVLFFFFFFRCQTDLFFYIQTQNGCFYFFRRRS
jgi:hypothetical protein